MDFVISNVTTVDEDDEEPLYEIKKVSIFKEKRENKPETESKVRVTTYKKTCYVPLCPNSTVATPEKMFITVPVNPFRRRQWLDAVGKVAGKNPKSPYFCCQDHFNLKRDMRNYEEYQKMGKVQMLLHQSVVPHIFICNRYSHLKRRERVEVLQKLHKEMSLDTLRQIEEDAEEFVRTLHERPEVKKAKLQRKVIRAAKRRRLNDDKVEKVKANKTVFIEMPAFEYEDKPDFVEANDDDDGVDTIIIDDSD